MHIENPGDAKLAPLRNFKNPRWPQKNMENQKYLPNYNFFDMKRTKVFYQVKLHIHAKFEKYTYT